VRHVLVGHDASPALVDAFRRATASAAPVALARRIREVVDVDARGDLRTCTAPLLCVSADADRLVPRHASDEMQSIRPDATHVRLQGPHVLLAPHPTQAVDSIVPWLAARSG
jgi:pimeloyl-ACP methyl ester carboxylesterase